MYFPAGSNPPKPSNHFCPTSSLTSICGHQWQQSRRRRRRRAGLMQALGPGWTGPGLRSLTPCFSFGASISATLQSLFSIRKRNACGRKVEAGRERGQHTHTQTQSARGGKEASRNTEDKMAFIRTAVEGQRSLIFSSFCSLSSFLASFHLSCEAYGRAPRFQIT